MNSLGTKILIAIIGFVAINFLAKQFFFRFDLTQNKEFTLSKATKDIIKNLDEKVNITFGILKMTVNETTTKTAITFDKEVLLLKRKKKL